MKVWMILLIILAIVVGIIIFLFLFGKRIQKKQDAQQQQIDAAKQSVTMLVIDKKKLRLKDSGLPSNVIAQAGKMMRRAKLPIVKARVGNRIMTFIAEAKVYDVMPVKKEVKAEVSGLYIVGVKAIRGSLDISEKEKKKRKKKGSKLDTLLAKGRGEM